eukprot:Nitzschia sp. Nitz4//scaffold43_size134323//44542//45978//NITZ4_003293-RA/size134323-processed-gene-0.37-mRNA-1//-1//CDS//3329551930//6623//frame0
MTTEAAFYSLDHDGALKTQQKMHSLPQLDTGAASAFPDYAEGPCTPQFVNNNAKKDRTSKCVSPDSVMTVFDQLDCDSTDGAAIPSSIVDHSTVLSESPESDRALPIEETQHTSDSQDSLDVSGDTDCFEDAHEQLGDTSATPTFRRRVSFADEKGFPLDQIRFLEAPPSQRLVILALSPRDRTYEFVHLEYPTDPSTTVQVLLEQLPSLLVHKVFSQHKFAYLSRLKQRTGQPGPLDEQWPLARCPLEDGELVLGVLRGHIISEMTAFAMSLLRNKKIAKAVSQGKRHGRGLKTVLSGVEWQQRQFGSDQASGQQVSEAEPIEPEVISGKPHLPIEPEDASDSNASENDNDTETLTTLVNDMQPRSTTPCGYETEEVSLDEGSNSDFDQIHEVDEVRLWKIARAVVEDFLVLEAVDFSDDDEDEGILMEETDLRANSTARTLEPSLRNPDVDSLQEQVIFSFYVLSLFVACYTATTM